jgi:hypothetical protein
LARDQGVKYGIDIAQLRGDIVRPVLRFLGLHSDAAENLVVGTALVESGGQFVRQLGGPALGLWQMEPRTHDDIWDNFLHGSTRRMLASQLEKLQTPAVLTLGALELIGNLYYGAAMCRVHYLRVRTPTPLATDALGMAAYWKGYYNTPLGAGTVDKALPHFQIACRGGTDAR